MSSRISLPSASHEWQRLADNNLLQPPHGSVLRKRRDIEHLGGPGPLSLRRWGNTEAALPWPILVTDSNSYPFPSERNWSLGRPLQGRTVPSSDCAPIELRAG